MQEMKAMWSSLRYAFRNLGRQPLFSAVALFSIALGIGANTAIFTLLDQLLLRSLAVPEPNRLVQLDLPGPRRGANFTERPFSFPMYLVLRDKVKSFSGLYGQYQTPVSFAAKGTAQGATALLVTGNYFDVLGLRPALGRTLHPSDDVARGGHPVTVLSHGFWQERFGADRSIVDKDVVINGQKYTVVGVAPARWKGTDQLQPPDLYVPMAMKTQITPTWDGMESSQFYFLHVFGRLAPGASPEQAKAETDAVLGPVLLEELSQLRDFTGQRRERFLGKRIVLLPAARGNLSNFETIQNATWTLMGLVGVVLLIACANVANLLLARGSSRKREIAIRLAMGASRAQLVRQLMTESMVLAAVGGLLGLLFSDWILAGIVSLQPGDGGVSIQGELDGRTLLFTLVITVLTGVLFGLLPALQSTRADVAPTLKDQAGTVTGGGVWLRKALVVGQISLSVVMLAAAGFFMKTLFELKRADPGFRAEQLLTFTVDPSLNGYGSERAEQFHTRLRDELAALPAVRAVSMASNPVLGDAIYQRTVRVPGYTPKEGEDMNPRINDLGPGFFRALGIPVLVGREFTETDTANSPRVAVVNEQFARYFFKGDNPIGRKIGMAGQADRPEMTIVGVVGNSKHGSPREDANQFRFLYLPMPQSEVVSGMSYYVRTESESTTVARDIRAILRRMDPNLPIAGMRTVREQIDVALTVERLISALCSSFGLIATLLASIGLYGVMAFHVARRTREIGIRMALGASRAKVLGMILREVTAMAALGILIGVPAALGVGRLVQSALFATEPTDPIVLAGSALLLVIVAVAAGWLPARRASSIDPMVALRYD